MRFFVVKLKCCKVGMLILGQIAKKTTLQHFNLTTLQQISTFVH